MCVYIYIYTCLIATKHISQSNVTLATEPMTVTTRGDLRIHVFIYIYIYTWIHNIYIYIHNEEFTRLAETRLAQNRQGRPPVLAGEAERGAFVADERGRH